jgi:hypothetical protein
VARGEYTGWVRKAKRRTKLNRMIELYPEDADRYRAMQADINAELKEAGVCLYCGRQIKSDDARKIGLGKDCHELLEQNGTLEQWLSSNSPSDPTP